MCLNLSTFQSCPISKYLKMCVVSIATLCLGLGLLPVALSRDFTPFLGELPPLRDDVIVLVVNGIDVESADKYPWQVFIELDNGTNQCGGSLISNQWILSAAHCFDSGKVITNIVMGSVWKNGNSSGAVFGAAGKVLCHKNYDTDTLDYDICLIKLTRPVVLGANVRPVALPSRKTRFKNGTACSVTGWGFDEYGSLPDILQQATVKIVDRDVCEAWYGSATISVVNNTICAGHEEGGQDTCGGDSGGPLVCRNAFRLSILMGVTSYGAEDCGSEKKPGIYTSVPKYLDWIYETMEGPPPKIPRWGSWSECSASCGVGTRKRRCFYNGKQVALKTCGDGPSKRDCSLRRCPVSACKDRRRDCTLVKYYHKLCDTAWKLCMRTCGKCSKMT